MTSARARPRGARAGTGLAPGPGRNRRVGLAWPRLPAAAEVAIIAAGYAGYALVRLAVRASRPAAVAHAAGLWRAERWLHLDIEPSLNHLAAARPVLAEAAGYYYGLAHFIITALVLAWLWLRRLAAFGPLRSALVLATTAANVVFWTWPVAPPRFAVPGLTDVLVRYRILGAGRPHGPDSLVNLYAAMPSLHVAWAAWCAAALVAATRGRWRHLAWLYPAATTVVVLATANHFVLDAAAGLAVTALGLLAARAARPDATGPGPGGAGPAAAPPALGPGAATRRRRPVIWWRRLARRWGWAVTGGAAVLIALRAPAVAADVRAALAHGLRLPWLGAAAAAEAVGVAGLVIAQRQLLAAAGARLPARAVAAAVFASTGLARLLPAGPAAAAAWQAGQYRRRDPASSTAGVWAVLAGGVASTAAALAVLAAGAIAAARWWLLLGGAATLAVVTAAAVACTPGRRGGPVAGPSHWPVTVALAAGHRPGRAGPPPARAPPGHRRAGGQRAEHARRGRAAGRRVRDGRHARAVARAAAGLRGRPARRAAGTAARRARRDRRRRARRVGAHRHPPRHRADRRHHLPGRRVLGTRRRRRHHGRCPHPPPPGPGRPAAGPAAPAGTRAAGPGAAAQPTAGGIRRGRTRSTSLAGLRLSCPPGPQARACSPTAGPASRTPPTAAGHAASARSPPEPGATGPAARHGCGPAPLPARHERHGATVIARRRNEEKKGTCHEHTTHPPHGRQRRVRGGRTGRPGRRGRGGRVPAAGHLARRRRPGSRRARHADRAVGRPLPVVHHPAARRRQRRRRQPDLRAGGGRRRHLRSGWPARVRRLQSGSALLGVWLIIAGPILNHKHAIADSMYWSNSWAGGVLIALAAASLAAVALRRPAA